MVKLKSDKEFIKNELAKIDIGENNKEEFEKMFFEFISARKNDYNEKVPSKGMLGIKRALNVLTKSKENGYDTFRVLKHSLNKGWRGLFYTNDSLINVPVSYNEVAIEDYKKVVAILQSGEVPTIENTAIYQINKLKKVAELQAKDDAEKVYEDKKAKENTEKLTAELRVYNACLCFNSKTTNDKNLFMNILDNGIGERSYLYLMSYFKNTITNKYPTDKERIKNFEMLYRHLPNYLKEKNYDYYPLILVYSVMTMYIIYNHPDDLTTNNFFKYFENNYKNNDIIQTHIFNIFAKSKWYGFIPQNKIEKVMNAFIEYYTTKYKILNPMFVVKYFYYTTLEKVGEKTFILESKGSFSRDVCETMCNIFTDWVKRNINNNVEISFCCKCYE